MSRANAKPAFRGRAWLVRASLLAGLAVLAARAVYLQVIHTDYLQHQGKLRHSRVVVDNSHRGMILDRNGVPLAVSTPVDSISAHPATLAEAKREWPRLAAALDMTVREIRDAIRRSEGREFTYLKRHVTPDVAKKVTTLGIDGVGIVREYRRYYPTGAMAGHALGFTNIDDRGQEGLELAYDKWLRAVPGSKRVLKDLHGNSVEVVESLRLPAPGRDLIISLDRRVQYLAYRALKAAVATHGARAGSAIVMDAQTGEVLAMVNEPDFNPNNRANLQSRLFRNRAVTDLFEPGSTLKPFTIAAALESGRFTATSLIDTGPGSYRVGVKTIRDTHNYGTLTLRGIIEKSSNVGAAKIALALGKQDIFQMVTRVGFGVPTGSHLPGEASGLMNPPKDWVPIDQATIAYGYGISVTPLQLARAYCALANGGDLVPVTMLGREAPPVRERVMSVRTSREIQRMLELAAGAGGTGTAAQVPDYRVAGKTGTVHKLTPQGYSADRYVSWFAGFAPVSNPRLVMVVTVDEPTRGGYFGGQIAAPVFREVMTGALRLLDIPPDAPRRGVERVLTAHAGATP